MTPWKQDLSALTLYGPYSGKGGQSRLARALGVTPQTVSDWCLDKRPPGPVNQRKLAEMARRAE